MLIYGYLYDIFTEVRCGIPSVVYMSPEAALSDRWMDWIRQHRKKICLLAFDEGHCIVDWLALGFSLYLLGKCMHVCVRVCVHECMCVRVCRGKCDHDCVNM